MLENGFHSGTTSLLRQRYLSQLRDSGDAAWTSELTSRTADGVLGVLH